MKNVELHKLTQAGTRFNLVQWLLDLTIVIYKFIVGIFADRKQVDFLRGGFSVNPKYDPDSPIDNPSTLKVTLHRSKRSPY